jgi:hypothetical protein
MNPSSPGPAAGSPEVQPQAVVSSAGELTGLTERLEALFGTLEVEAAKVPRELVHGAVGKVKRVYAELAQRYGPGYARAIIAAGLVGLPVPIPFSTALTAAPVIAAAEIHRALARHAPLPAVGAAAELSVARIEALAKKFRDDLARVFAEQPAGDFEGLVHSREEDLGRELTREEYAALLADYLAGDRPA